MKKNRLIPVILLKNGWIVQSKEFNRYQNLGNPITAVSRISEWGSDELIYLDISKNDKYDIKRSDQNYPNRNNFLEIIKDVAKVTFMPMTVGGKINSLCDIERRLKLGADKISINSKAITNIEFVEESAREFGSQCIVVSVDAKIKNDKYYVYNNKTSSISQFDVLEYCKKVESCGAGEILLNSVDRDGSGDGYDIKLLQYISAEISIPVIACGGVGDWHHFTEAFNKTKVDAVAAANIFHYRDQSVFLAKKYLYENDIPVRKPSLLNIQKKI